MDGFSDLPTSPTLLRRLGDLTDHGAWEEFVERYAGPIHAWCRKWGLPACDADEATQEILVALYHRLGSPFEYDPSKGFRNYLKRAATNAAKDALRALGRRDRGSGDTAVHRRLAEIPAPEGLEVAIEKAIQQEELLEAMAKVEMQSPTCIRAFRLILLENLSVADAAARLDMTPNALYKAIHDAKVKIKAEIARMNPPDEP